MKKLTQTILTTAMSTFLPLLPQILYSQTVTYKNPVIETSAPDPTVIRAEDGSFYLYATEDIHNVPIFHSLNLVDWKQVGNCFYQIPQDPNGSLKEESGLLIYNG